MSRHELASLPEHQGISIAVGWDRPLSTYFAIVRTEGDLVDEDGEEQDPFMVWIGTSYAEVDDPAVVTDAVREFAEVPERLLETLFADRDAER